MPNWLRERLRKLGSRFVRVWRFIQRKTQEIAPQLLGVTVFVGVVYILSVMVGGHLKLWLKQTIGYTGDMAEGLIFNFVAAWATVFALWNTMLILRKVTSDIHSFSDLLKRVNKDLERITTYDRAMRSLLRPYFYMYVKTPSLGHISGEPEDYENFRRLLETALTLPEVTIRVVCLKPDLFDSFHETATKDPTLKSSYLAEATRVFSLLSNGARNRVKTEPAIAHSFLVVTDERAWQFIVKPLPGSNRNEAIGREIRNASDIRFAREALDRYWEGDW